MWKFTSENGYPDISLHDCVIERVRLDGKDAVFTFNDSGFWVGKHHPQNPFGELLRTDKAELRLENIDTDSFSFFIHKNRRFAGKRLFTTRKELSFASFAAKINSRQWTFEFVDEYYGYHRAMFCGLVRTAKSPYLIDTQMQLSYTKSRYYWNAIHQDRTW